MTADDPAVPAVACVLLNWNGWQDTLRCLAALGRTDYVNLSVIVVDNGSSDDSVDRIRAAFAELRLPHASLVETGRNLGFAGGVNAGIRCALERNAQFVWLLNNDAEPLPDALTALIGKAGTNPRYGAVGSVLLYAHDPGTVQAWGGGRINCWIGHASHATGFRDDEWFDYITAASVLLPARAFEDIGLLDERFFLYWEDGDLSFRLRHRGWKLGVAAESTVLHRENASTGGDRSKIDRFSTASGIQFLHKHSRVPWVSISLFLLLRLGKRLALGRFKRVGAVVGGVYDYVKSKDRDPRVS